MKLQFKSESDTFPTNDTNSWTSIANFWKNMTEDRKITSTVNILKSTFLFKKDSAYGLLYDEKTLIGII